LVYGKNINDTIWNFDKILLYGCFAQVIQIERYLEQYVADKDLYNLWLFDFLCV